VLNKALSTFGFGVLDPLLISVAYLECNGVDPTDRSVDQEIS